MLKRAKIPFFSWGLGLLTVLVLLSNLPTVSDLTIWLFFAVLLTLLLNLGTSLSEGIVTPALTAALMAYLTLDKRSDALWAVAAGSLLGSLIWGMRIIPIHRNYIHILRNITISTAQLTLSVYAGSCLYRWLDGQTPLNRLQSEDILPLAVLVISYLVIYLEILALEIRFYRYHEPKTLIQHWHMLVGIIVIPLPFAALGAVIYHQLSSLAFALLVMGLLIVVGGVHLINQTQIRYRQQVRELSALSTVSRAMRTNLDLNAVLDVVYQQVTRLLQTPNFSVALVDTGRNQLYFPLNIEQHHQASLPPRELKDGLIEYVIQQKVPLLIADHVAQHTQALGLTPPPMPVYSWMAVPLVAPERVLGCLVVYSSNPAQLYTKNDLRLLATLAGQVGIAIDNAQLYGQAKDRSMQLSTLNNVANILSGTLDIQQTLDLTGSSAIAVANCDAMALYMWGDGIQRPLTLARQNGLSEAFAANPMQPLMLSLDDLHRRRQPMIVTDVLIDHRAADLRPVMEREQNRSWIEFLLRKGEDLIGVLIFFYEKPRAFNAEEIELLRNFSNQAALAISNARLYTQTDAALNRRVEQLSALADISRELVSTLNLQGLFELVLSRALEATQSRTGLLLIRQETTDAAPSLVAHRGFEPGLFDKINPLSNYVAQTYQTGLPTLIPDFAQERDFTPNDPKTHSQLNVPIVQGEDVLGVISLGNDRANEYSQDDMSFVTQLAVQARIAIDNARLFRNIEIARDRLQVILDSMKEAVILINPEGLITLANPRVDRLLGLAPERILHIPIASLLGDPDLQMAARLGFGGDDALLNSLRNLGTGHWDESSRDSGRVTFEIATPKRRFIDRTDAPVRDETGHAIGLLMVFADVTEERELAQAREDLSSMIVHDLRGPLTALTTSLTLLDEIASEDDPFGKVVIHTTDLASRAVRKMLNLVNSLLDVSKMESGTIALEQEPTQFTQLCINVVDELSPLAQEMAVSLMADLPENLPLLYVDADKTERVLLNLVDNAIKFAPQDGSIVIRAHQPGSIPVPDGFMRLEVQDTGPGIPDEYKERLFDRYAQVDGVRGRRRGTGLGLTFCRMAIEAHGGKIWVEDNPAGGTVFVFTLPLVDIKKLELSNTD